MAVVRQVITVSMADPESETGETDVEVIVETDPDSYSLDAQGRGTPVWVRVTTNPLRSASGHNYYQDVTLRRSSPTATITGPTEETQEIEDEEVSLASEDGTESATGQAKYPINSSFSSENYGGIGESSSTPLPSGTTLISYQQLGTRGLRTQVNCLTTKGKISYSTVGRKWKVSGQTEPNFDVALELEWTP